MREFTFSRFQLALFSVGLTIIFIVGGALAGIGVAAMTNDTPTYHCDGSDTMGYAAPGTPEASACWVEGVEANNP